MILDDQGKLVSNEPPPEMLPPSKHNSGGSANRHDLLSPEASEAFVRWLEGTGDDS